jgi:hypothetical protein
MLGVQLDADVVDHRELGVDPLEVTFLADDQTLEQLPRPWITIFDANM